MKPSKRHSPLPFTTALVGTIAVAVGLALAAGPATAQSSAKKRQAVQSRLSVVLPVIDALRGRRLFVTKGCFICHSVKGVGGKAAPPLDATSSNVPIDVLGFVGRMWKGAPLMFELQSMELGYRVELKAGEMADLAGFIGNAKAQEGFSLAEIPEVVRDWMVNKAWWKDPSIKLGEMLPDKFPDLDGAEPYYP